jgi:hypothetical protein
MRRLAVLAIVAIATAAVATPAAAHDERPTVPLTSTGTIPAFRADPAGALLVCGTDRTDFDQRTASFSTALRTRNVTLWTQCQQNGYHDLQAAVNAVTKPGQSIHVLPGVYPPPTPASPATPASPTAPAAPPKTAATAVACTKLKAPHSPEGYLVLSWDQQNSCPNLQNMVAVLGKQYLQIDGTGAQPSDVVIDAQFQSLLGIRVDRSPGFYLYNLTVEHTTSTAVEVMETDGFELDTVATRYDDEDGVLVYASDHGLVTDCETYGNGNAGLAIESTVSRGHPTVEIRRCVSHHNTIGLSSTGGNTITVHDNTLQDNSVGARLDSLAAGHPDLPQHDALLSKNVIANNNSDYYGFVRDGTCARPEDQRGYTAGVVCPMVGVPVGTGVVLAGADRDTFSDNWVYGNQDAGFAVWWAPGVDRSDHRLAAQFDTGNGNKYLDNVFGRTQAGVSSPNGIDVWWDGEGRDSCWRNVGSASSNPSALPSCDDTGSPSGLGTGRYVADPLATLALWDCSSYDFTTAHVPSGCDWYGAKGWSRTEVRFAVGEAGLLALVLLLLWLRVLRGRRALPALVGLGASLAGLSLMVLGTWSSNGDLLAIGLTAFGIGLGLSGAMARRRGRSALGWFTVFLAGFALLDALDRGLYPLPLLPFPPSAARVALELVWLPWALVAALTGRVMATQRRRPPLRRRHRDPLLRFAQSLRS